MTQRLAPEFRHDAEEGEEDKKDADGGTMLDKFLSKLDARLDDFGSRLDALEEREDGEHEPEGEAKEDKKDGEDEPDEKKADGEEEPEAKEDGKKDAKKDEGEDRGEDEPKEVVADKKKDGAMKDGEMPKEMADAFSAVLGKLDKLGRRISDVERLVPKNISDGDHNDMLEYQGRADAAFAAFGDHAPRPLLGEDLPAYRRRIVGKLKVHSPAWEKANLHAVSDGVAFDNIEREVFADAAKVAKAPISVPEGVLRCDEHRTPGGHTVRTYYGRTRSWMDDFADGARQSVVSVADRA